MIEELKLSIPQAAEVTLEMHNNDLKDLNDRLNEKIDEKVGDVQTLVDRNQEEAEKQLNNHEGRLKALEYQIELLRKMSAPTDGGPNMIEEMKLGYGEEKLSMEKEIEKLSAEPASEPIAHNPEGEVKQSFKSFGQNRVMNTRDRVMNRIANLK